jgi:hypothetical protein
MFLGEIINIQKSEIVIWCKSGGGGFRVSRAFFARFTNLFFLAMCQIRQHKDSIRKLRSCELLMDEAWNNQPTHHKPPRPKKI